MKQRNPLPMKEKTLLRIALICSVIGVALLFIFSESAEINEKSISDISSGDIGEYVKIKGEVTKALSKEGVIIITIQQPSQINVVLFRKEPLEISEGDFVEVIGKIDDYKGKAEIIGDKIRVVS